MSTESRPPEIGPGNLVAVALAGVAAAVGTALLGVAGTVAGAAMWPVLFVVVRELARWDPTDPLLRRAVRPVATGVAVAGAAAAVVALPLGLPALEVPDLGPRGVLLPLGDDPPPATTEPTTVFVSSAPTQPPPVEPPEPAQAAGTPGVDPTVTPGGSGAPPSPVTPPPATETPTAEPGVSEPASEPVEVDAPPPEAQVAPPEVPAGEPAGVPS